MRYREIIESYSDDTETAGSEITSPDFNLTITDYTKEQADLMVDFSIDDSEMAKTIRTYTEASSINGALISGRKLGSKLQKQQDELLSLKTLGCSLSRAHHVYSGTGIFDPSEIIKRKVFKSAAFISASLNIEVAAKTNNFRREKKHGEDDYVLHFMLPKGYKCCFYIGPYSTFPEELEMMIFPNERFKLVGTTVLELDDCHRHIFTMAPA